MDDKPDRYEVERIADDRLYDAKRHTDQAVEKEREQRRENEREVENELVEIRRQLREVRDQLGLNQ